ncbi:FUSC family protein [Streptomyces smyrnaeus]|uniref:FUSC family protein n=1 Tax=Streptomyces smyrnaeus TaxID=1387713 RepID=UPI0033BE60F5
MLENMGRLFVAAGQRVWEQLWPLTQQAAALALSWWVARHLVQHHSPVFAPIAAVVGLNAARGERGSNAVRMFLGVFIGIATAEIGLAALGDGVLTLACATFVAMLVAVALDGERIVIAQAAASAVVAVATGTQEAGTGRLIDAVIGAAVALLFSQVLFASDPAALVHHADSAALTAMGRFLHAVAGSLAPMPDGANRHPDAQELHGALAQLDTVRAVGHRARVRSLIWRRRHGPTAWDSSRTSCLQRLGNACLMLPQTLDPVGTRHIPAFGQAVRELGDILTGLAEAAGDATAQHTAHAQAQQVRRRMASLLPQSSKTTASEPADLPLLIGCALAEDVARFTAP